MQTETIDSTTVNTSLGPIRIGVGADGLNRVQFLTGSTWPDPTSGTRRVGRERPESSDRPIESCDRDDVGAQWGRIVARRIDGDFAADPEGEGDAGGLPLAPCGSAFQLRVWRALAGIAPGRTLTYGELAIALGQPNAARAVANACAANPLAVIVPCHRVLPRSGGVGGYRWGAERKRILLEREASLGPRP